MLLPLLIKLGNKNTIFFSNKVIFHLNDLVNKHNVRCWSEANLRVTIEIVMQSTKVYVCCSMSESHMIVGPYFFDDDTINGQNSHSMLKELFVSELKR